MVTNQGYSSLQLDENREIKNNQKTQKPPITLNSMSLPISPVPMPRLSSSDQLRDGVTNISMDERFRSSLREQDLPRRVHIVGEKTAVEVATLLLHKHTKSIVVADNGTPVLAVSMERFGSMFIGYVLDGDDISPLYGKMLLYNIPESMIDSYAEKNGVKTAETTHNGVRLLLDNMEKKQPQTFFSLSRSARRLLARKAPDKTCDEPCVRSTSKTDPSRAGADGDHYNIQ